LERCWRNHEWSDQGLANSDCAGFSRSDEGQDEAAGATTALAATAPASAAPRRNKSRKADEEISPITRLVDESADLKLGILPAHEREKLVSRPAYVTESAKHGAGDGLAICFSTRAFACTDGGLR